MMVFQPQGQRGGGTCADKPRERAARGVDEHSSSRGWHGPHAGEPSGAGGPRSSTQRRTASLGVRKDLLRYECVFCMRTHTRTRTPMSNCELLPHPRLHPAFTQRPSFPTGTPFQSHVRRMALRLAQIRNPPSLPRHPCLQSCQERARQPQDEAKEATGTQQDSWGSGIPQPEPALQGQPVGLCATTVSLNCGKTCSLPFSLLQVGGIKHVVQPSPPNLPPTTRAFSPSQTDSPRWTLTPRPPPQPPASCAVPMRPAPAGSPCERFHTAPALLCLVYLFH